jgi:A/G-specific adenine glycosylase
MDNITTSLDPIFVSTIQQRVLKWGADNYKIFPWRQATSTWHGLVAEMMLQRTRVRNVVTVYQDFVDKFPTPASVLSASDEELKEVLYPLGLPERAKWLRQLAQVVVDSDNKIPDKFDELVKLPGIGSYIAAAWLSFHGGKRAVIIDANVVRWICRLIKHPMNGETRRKKWLRELANQLTPISGWKEYNYAVLDFTMDICALRPKCDKCPLGSQYCLTGREILSSDTI